MSEEEILEYLEQQRAYAHKFNNKQIISITNVSLKLIKKQQKEIEKKDKIISAMAEELINGIYKFKSKKQVIDHFTNKYEERKNE